MKKGAERLRILAFLTSYFSLSGDGIHERRVVKGLIPYAHVFVVAARLLCKTRGSKHSFDNRKDRVVILPVIKPIVLFELFYGFLIGIYLSLLRFFKKETYDIIYLRSNFAGIGFNFLRRFHKIPIVLKFVSFSTDEYFMYNKNILTYIMSKVFYIVEKVVALTSDKVLVPSSLFTIEMIRRYNIPKFKIENLSVCLDLKEFSISVKSRESSGYFTIGYFGSFSSQNDIDCLLMAIYLLRSKIKNIRALVVTQSTISNFIKKAKKLNIKDIIDIKSAVHKEIPKLMSYVDIIVVPRRILSTAELVIPLKLLEAGAAKKPVIVSRSNIIEYALEDMKQVLMYEPENSEDLAEKILMLHNNIELEFKLSNSLYIFVKSYDWLIIIKKLKDILSNVVCANMYARIQTS